MGVMPNQNDPVQDSVLEQQGMSLPGFRGQARPTSEQYERDQRIRNAAMLRSLTGAGDGPIYDKAFENPLLQSATRGTVGALHNLRDLAYAGLSTTIQRIGGVGPKFENPEDAYKYGNFADQIAAELDMDREEKRRQIEFALEHELRRVDEDTPLRTLSIATEHITSLGIDLPTWIASFPIRGTAELTRTMSDELEDHGDPARAFYVTAIEGGVLLAIPKVLGGGATKAARAEYAAALRASTVRGFEAQAARSVAGAVESGSRRAIVEAGREAVIGAGGMIGLTIGQAAAEEAWISIMSDLTASGIESRNRSYFERLGNRLGGEDMLAAGLFGAAFRTHSNASARRSARLKRKQDLKHLDELRRLRDAGEISQKDFVSQQTAFLRYTGDFAARTQQAVDSMAGIEQLTPRQRRQLLNETLTKAQRGDLSGRVKTDLLGVADVITHIMGKKGEVVTMKDGTVLFPAGRATMGMHAARPLFNFEKGDFGRTDPQRLVSEGKNHTERYRRIQELAEKFDTQLIDADGNFKLPVAGARSAMTAEQLLAASTVEGTSDLQSIINSVTGVEVTPTEAQLALEFALESRERGESVADISRELSKRRDERAASVGGIEGSRDLGDLQAESVKSLDKTLEKTRSGYEAMPVELQAEVQQLLGELDTPLAAQPVSSTNRKKINKILKDVGDGLEIATRDELVRQLGVSENTVADMLTPDADGPTLARTGDSLDLLNAKLTDINQRANFFAKDKEIAARTERVMTVVESVAEVEAAAGLGVLQQIERDHGGVLQEPTTLEKIRDAFGRTFSNKGLGKFRTNAPYVGAKSDALRKHRITGMRGDTRLFALSGGTNTETYRVGWYNISEGYSRYTANDLAFNNAFKQNDIQTGIADNLASYSIAGNNGKTPSTLFTVGGTKMTAEEVVVLYTSLRDPQTLTQLWGKKVDFETRQAESFTLNKSTFTQLTEAMADVKDTLNIDSFARSDFLIAQANQSQTAIDFSNHLATVEGRIPQSTVHGQFFPRRTTQATELNLDGLFNKGAIKNETFSFFTPDADPASIADVIGLRSSSPRSIRVSSEADFKKKMAFQNTVANLGVPLTRAREMVESPEMREVAKNFYGAEDILSGYTKTLDYMQSRLLQEYVEREPIQQAVSGTAVAVLGGSFKIPYIQLSSVDVAAPMIPAPYRVSSTGVLRQAFGIITNNTAKGLHGAIRVDALDGLADVSFVPAEYEPLSDLAQELVPLYGQRVRDGGRSVASALAPSEMAATDQGLARQNGLTFGIKTADACAVTIGILEPCENWTIADVSTLVNEVVAGAPVTPIINYAGFDMAPAMTERVDDILEAAGVTRNNTPEEIAEAIRKEYAQVLRIDPVTQTWRNRVEHILPTQPMYDPLHLSGYARERRTTKGLGGFYLKMEQMFRSFRDSAFDQTIKSELESAYSGQEVRRQMTVDARVEELFDRLEQDQLDKLTDKQKKRGKDKAVKAGVDAARGKRPPPRESTTTANADANKRMYKSLLKAQLMYSFVSTFFDAFRDKDLAKGNYGAFLLNRLTYFFKSMVSVVPLTDPVLTALSAKTGYGQSAVERGITQAAAAPKRAMKDIQDGDVPGAALELAEGVYHAAPFAGPVGQVAYAVTSQALRIRDIFEAQFGKDDETEAPSAITAPSRTRPDRSRRQRDRSRR